MSQSVKVAISLPQELFAAAERERKAGGESRSELYRRAIDAYLRHRHEQRAVEQYISGYQKYPETAHEVAAVHELSEETLSKEQWD
jgi:metal-responsive CopG/Arc/MetJ family transcriptional regulator